MCFCVRPGRSRPGAPAPKPTAAARRASVDRTLTLILFPLCCITTYLHTYYVATGAGGEGVSEADEKKLESEDAPIDVRACCQCVA